LVVTESGALYVTDNGANQGWGGLPENQGTVNATNNYIPGEPGSTASNPAPGGESVDNVDHLQLVTTNLNTYTFNSLYGGHPNPVRANPQGAGLYTDNISALGTFGSPIWRTQIYDPDGSRPNSTTNPNEGLPANWPPVQIANPVEGDWRGPTVFNPDGPQDNPVVTWGTNTNSIAEYTASNFNGALKGNLLAGHSGGNIRRVILSQDGTTGTLEPNFFSGLGGNVLGLTSNGDNDIFPGTVWGGTFNGNIVVLEPQDAINCIAPGDPEFDPLADYDDDGYTNQDEIDNGTDYCNGGSQPSDFDKILGPPFISDLNDTDDDGDGIADAEDPSQLGNPLKSANEQAFTIPIANDLFNDQQGLGGIFGLGMTGLMNNGETGPNWLNWIDRRDDPNDPNPNDVLGGAPGIMTSHMTSGTANGSINNQEKGYQYGVKVDANTSPFSVIGGMNGFSGSNLRLYGNTAAIGGELGFFIGDGTQSNFIKFVVTVDGFTVQQEIDDIPQLPTSVVIPVEDRTTDKIRFYFVVNPANGEVSLSYRIDSNPKANVTTLIAQGKILEALQDIDKDLAVGFIGTSGAAGVELEGSWDFLNVLDSQPFVNLPIPNIDRLVGSPSEAINLNNYFTDDGDIEELTFTVTENTDSSIGAIIIDNILSLTFPALPALSNITIRATDAEENFVEQSFTVIVTDEPTVLYRVNAGGPEIAAIDDAGVNWSADTVANNNEYLQEPGSNTTFSTTINSTTNINTDNVPVAIFTTERYDSNPGPPNLTYAFPVSENGNYEVRLYLMNGFDGTSQPGQRVFNVTIEGNPYPQLSGVDLSDRFGHKVGSVISTVVPVNDGEINISFLHDTENPLINGIEILEATSLDTPIYFGVIPDQNSFPGEALDGSLGVVAIGGDGNLQFSATGLPPGVEIEPTNGQIGGALEPDSADNSPYLVTITIDDSDLISTDAVTLQFLWTVEIIPLEIVAIDDFISEVEDNINVPITTNGGFPLETITFGIEGQPNGISIDSETGIITGTIPEGAEIGGPNNDGIYNVTITATGTESGPVISNFIWTVKQKSLVVFRLNAGGGAFTATDGELDWVANNTIGAVNGEGYNVNTGNIAVGNLIYANRDSSIPDYIDEATYTAIFAQERWDPPTAPEMQFDIPLPNGDYIVNLYLGNSFSGTSAIGSRVFDISVEEILAVDNLDLVATFGNQVGGMISLPVTLNDEVLNILFEHVVENPLINAIEILNVAAPNAPILVNNINDQTNFVGDEINPGFGVEAFGGTGDLKYTEVGLPPGISLDPNTGEFSGIIELNAEQNSPYNVVVTVDDSDDITTDAVSVEFTWTIIEKPLVAFRLNAGGTAFTATDGELDWVANNTTGAVNGLGYSVNTGNITTGNLIYANRDNSIPSYIDEATYNTIFAQERWDPPALPEMQFDIPLPNGDYIINLYLGNSFSGTSTIGSRIFSISVEGILAIDNLDLVAIFGNQSGGMISVPVSLTDEVLNVLFERVVENPLINAIEILNAASVIPPIIVNNIENQFSFPGETLESGFGVIASGGEGNLQYSAINLPPGISINATNGQITGTIGLDADTNSPYNVSITVDDSDLSSNNSVTISFIWVVTNNFWFDKNENENYTGRHECSFVQAGDKFYLFGGRENAQSIDIYDYTTNTWNTLANSAPFEFNHFQAVEYEGLIWVIGAYKTNSFPSETPADFIWTFNPATQEWVQGPEIPATRKRGSAGLVVHNDKFYVLAGNTNGHSGGYVSWFDEYDPHTGIWTELPDAPRARDHFHSAVINGKLYAASGRLSGGPEGVFSPVVSEIDVYDFATESWSTLPSILDIPTPRAGAIVANFEDKLIIAGGESLASTDAFSITEIFDPIAQSWSLGAPLINQRHGTQGIVSGGGLFVAGGSPVRGGGNQKNMEFYGQDNPIGTASVSSILSAETSINFEIGETKTISISNGDGNVGAILKDITITGNDAAEFSLDSGNIPFKLIGVNASHNLIVSYLGTDLNEKNAILTINYNNSDSLIITLSATGYNLIYDGTSWSPNAPSETTVSDNAIILDGEYTVDSDIALNILNIRQNTSVIVEPGNSISTEGDIKGNGTLELLSSSTLYSSLISNGTVEGNILYKRHVNRTANPGASDANDLISAPLTGQSFVQFLSNNDNIVSNSTNTLYLFGPFNKATGAYVVYSDTETATLDPAIGYRAASTNTSTFTFTGAVNTGPISVPISNSGPAFQIWNLIGNPYPSYIKVGDFLNENNSEFANNSAAIYGYDGNASDGWTVWNLAYAAQNPNALIAPGQGFFVSSKPEGGNVNFLPSMREKGTSDDFILGRSASSISSYLRLNLFQNERLYHTDFYFNANASRGLDKGYDAQIWGGTAPNFSIFSYLAEGNTGLPLAIQSLDEADFMDLTIPLGVKATVGQQLKISIAENTLPSTIGVYLEDALAQTSVLLNNNDFVLTPGSTLNTFGRFYLAFRDNALSLNNSEFNKLKIFSNFESQSIIIYGLMTEPTTAKLYDAQGRLVISKPLIMNTMQQSLYTHQLEKGVYIISLESNSNTMTQKLIIK
jgi:hypothetical protein